MAVMEKFTAVIVVLSCVLLVFTDADDVFLTQEEELQLDKHFRLLNKPALKTIRMRNGDLYDCVDFYKQPAFDHPLLKNHTFHPQRVRPTIKSRFQQQQIEPMRVDCPVGTVPIRRISKDALRSAKLHEKRYKSKQRLLTYESPGFHYAIVRTRIDPNKKFSAAGAVITAYNISVGQDQNSLSRMQLQRGPDSIQVGFMVNPDLYNDAPDTRLFIYTKTTQIECFNIMCPGFIQVNPNIPLDGIAHPVSRKGWPTCTITFFIHRADNGNWWLELGSTREKIGFWPSSIFGGGGLVDLATSIDWGGEVFSPLGVSSPPMGASDRIYGHARPKFDAYCARLTTADETLVEVDAIDTEPYSDVGKFYQVLDKGFLNQDFKHLMFFGGPGGAIGN